MTLQAGVTPTFEWQAPHIRGRKTAASGLALQADLLSLRAEIVGHHGSRSDRLRVMADGLELMAGIRRLAGVDGDATERRAMAARLSAIESEMREQ